MEATATCDQQHQGSPNPGHAAAGPAATPPRPEPPSAPLPRSFVDQVSEEDPGIAIVYDDAGVAAHAARAGMTADELKQAVAAAVTGAGMVAAAAGDEDGTQGSRAPCALFSGNVTAFGRAMTAVAAMRAVRHVPPATADGQLQAAGPVPDVGVFYIVTPGDVPGSVLYAPVYCILNMP